MVAMNSANQDGSLDSDIGSDLGITTRGSFKFEDMAQVLHNSSTDLVDDSYLAGVNPLEKTWVISDSGSIGATGDWSAAGGSGSPLNIDDPVALEADLTNAFKEIISVSSTFVAASVPVNVFNRAETLDNLYIALFEAQATQRWPGNIKKLKLKDTDVTPDGIYDAVVDNSSPQQPGFESTGPDRGRLAFNALTYWTDVTTLPVSSDADIPVGVDGRVVDRGGAGQKITGFINDGIHVIGDTNSTANSRQVFVEPATVTNGAGNVLDDFDADTVAVAALKALADQNKIPSLKVTEAIQKYGINPDKPNPISV